MNQPIGIFDSGLGGLTVVKEFLHILPNEPIVYFGDTARVPYGTKSKETITRFSAENIRFLKSFDIKMVVIACHSASSLALESMQEEFSLPILGVVEPGAEKAVASTKNGRIGVIGTRSTTQSRAYQKAIHKLDRTMDVFNVACPLFVSLIEEGWLDGPIVNQIVEHYLHPLKQSRIDTLVLGCTHYPILHEKIAEQMGPGVRLINPAEEAGLKAKNELQKLGLISSTQRSEPQVQYYVSDEADQFKTLGEHFLGRPLDSVTKVNEKYFEATRS